MVKIRSCDFVKNKARFFRPFKNHWFYSLTEKLSVIQNKTTILHQLMVAYYIISWFSKEKKLAHDENIVRILQNYYSRNNGDIMEITMWR